MSAGCTAINTTTSTLIQRLYFKQRILRILGKTIENVPVIFFHTGSKSLIAHRFVFDDRSLVEIQGYGCLGNPLTYLPHCLDVTEVKDIASE